MTVRPVISRSSSEHDQHDPNIDKFSILFRPSTPRASPTLPPLPPHPSITAFRSQARKEQQQYDGVSLISVSADEDPLSLSLASSGAVVPSTFEWDKDDGNELVTTPVLTPVLSAPVASLPQRSSSHPKRTDNASLSFFDKFAQDAKRNSEIRRKGLVDELLKYQDDPLYFLHNEKDSAAQKQNEEHHHHEDLPPNNDPDNDKHSIIISDPALETSLPSSSSPPPIDTFLHDLDHEYFSSGRLVDTDTHDDNNNDKAERHLSNNSSHHTRSPSIPSPATLAPPIIDSNVPVLRKTPSSTFSARWMSNLLKTGTSGHQHQHHQQGHGVTPTLESIFGVNADTSSSTSTSTSHPPSRNSPPTAASTASAIYRRNSSSPPIRYHPTPHPQLHLSYTLPTPSSSLDGIIKHKASPFGTHSYIPPSGAPGFKGDSYDWDKGFSNELEKEIIIGRGRTGDIRGERRSGADNGGGGGGEILETEMQAHHKRTDVGVGIGIGAFMEKKSGSLDLKGRKASTEPVLSQDLAILLRPHLPALSRLPRSWTLIYSLDQHGISLNTLYARCEEASSPSRAPQTKTDGVGLGTRGVLLIIKDAGAAGDERDEGVFGAWIADVEGFGMGKKGGKGYFGGGESFLWKFTQGTLKVYKTTGRNNYVALCEPGYISFGGGDGHYGLYLDDTLYNGSSAPCPTFDNEPLCSPGPKKAGTATVEFECVGLEVWGMGP